MPNSQIDIYLTSEDSNWSEINESNCIIDGRKLVWFSQAVIDVGNIQKAFG